MSDTVTLEFPAETRNVALARTVAAAMAARVDLPLDQLEDVRLAVDEAVTQAIAVAKSGSSVTCAFETDGNVLRATITTPTDALETPSTTSFGWTVLSALVDSAAADLSDGHLAIRLQVTSDLVDV